MAGKFDLSAALGQRETLLTTRTIEDVTRDVLREKARIGSSIISIGKSLMEAKAMLQHGEWLPWLKEQAGFSERSAQQYMQVAADPQLSRNPKLVSYLGLSKSMKICALPEAEREAIVTTSCESEAGTAQVVEMVDKVVRKTQKRATPTGLTRWERIVAGGVDAMAGLLDEVRESPERFPQRFAEWLCERDYPPAGK